MSKLSCIVSGLDMKKADVIRTIREAFDFWEKWANLKIEEVSGSQSDMTVS